MWFRYLKERCVWRHWFESLDQAREVIAAYIDHYHHRPHSGFDYRTPKEVRQTWDDARVHYKKWPPEVSTSARSGPGLDMTDAQLAKARPLAYESGFRNMDFRTGYIEHPPIDDGSFDCVISNGVINLSPDRRAVFPVAARALRLGGRLARADIVAERQLPEGVTCDASPWAACIGGAMQRDAYRERIEAAGVEIDTWRENSGTRFVSERADNAIRRYGVTSVSLLARRT